MNPKDKDPKDVTISDIYQCLGSIEGKLDSGLMKTNYALIGLLAAMIGVKILGTDIFLDIATFMQLFAGALSVAVVVLALRNNKNGSKLTPAGWWLLVFVFFTIINTGLVYFRDLGYVNPRYIYINRICLGISLAMFAWKMLGDHRLIKKRDNQETPQVKKGSGKKVISEFVKFLDISRGK